ncbi:putative transcriptional regulatory protein TcrX [Planctomycetes bacterium Poly30]|uniref:Putative transcriptional regulatory protein TcrX n=1 Tax=Saltatorellus ferox TaxID=2528018 RepID=A0A518ES67_9BACT|nr:putative transcriptional regulatory protein TcrX [Planctomycetes bacterium Poly30]
MTASRENRESLRDPKTVLVVDDHELVRNLMVRVLEAAGLKAVAVGTGLDAIELVRRDDGQLGCVVQDLSMPEMRGEEVIRQLNEIRPGLPIVAFSAQDEHSAAERLAGLDVAGYEQKPFQIQAMVELIRGLIQRS